MGAGDESAPAGTDASNQQDLRRGAACRRRRAERKYGEGLTLLKKQKMRKLREKEMKKRGKNKT